MKKKLFATIVLSAIMVFAFSAVAMANDGVNSSVNYNTLVDNKAEMIDHGAVIVGPEQKVDKNEYMKAVEDFCNDMRQYSVVPFGNLPVTTTISDRQYADCKGSNIAAYFSTDVDSDRITTRFTGNATTTWAGLDQYNADGVNLENVVTVKGTSLSASGGLGGFTVSGSSTSKVYRFTRGAENNFTITHNYNNIAINGNCSRINQNVTGDFRFGTSYFSVGADDYSLL